MTAVILSPAIAHADTPITTTTVITEVYASNIYLTGMSCSGYPSADWTPVYSTSIKGKEDNNFGGWVKGTYTGAWPTCDNYKIIADFGNVYTATSVRMRYYGNMTMRIPFSKYCASTDCWQNPDSASWNSTFGSAWWYSPTITPTWSGVQISDTSAPTRYWMAQIGGETGDAAGAYLSLDAVKIALAEPITTTTVITVPDCTVITNSHFISGTTGWTTSNVITAPSEAIFEAGGQVAQSVDVTYTNLITNGTFENGVSGWLTSWGDTIGAGTGYTGNGLAITAAGTTGLGAKIYVNVRPNTNYSYFFRIKPDSALTRTVHAGLHTTGYSILGRSTIDGTGQWSTYTGTANSGSNTTIIFLVICGNCGSGAIYLDDVVVVQGESIPTSAMVRWVGRSTETFPVNATVTLNTTTGSGSATRQFSGLKQEFTDVISGYFASDYEIVINADQGFALDYVCVTPGGTAGSTGAETCYTVDDASFDSGEPWTLTAATISGGAVTLNAWGSAAQTVSLSPGMQYTVVMSAAFAQAGDLSITLGDHTEEITIPIAASLNYQQVFSVTSGDQLELSSTSGGVSVQYICYNEQARAYGECLPLIPNGEFDANTDWQYRNGAVWNNVAANAFIPAIAGGTFGNVGLGAVGQYPLQGMLPDLLPGEFLILQFDARSTDNGIVTARIRDIGIDDPVTITYTAATKNQYTRYQVPVSQLAGHDGAAMDIGFFNTGLLTSTTATTTDIAVFVDNVCMYLSNEEPQLPVTNPIYGGYNGGLPFTCGTVSQWLYGLTGINFPELEAMSPPSAWEFSNWVPWLAGRLWVNVGKPLSCLLVSLFNSSSFMSAINFLNWLAVSVSSIVNWLSSWFLSGLGYILSLATGFLNLGKILLWDISNIINWIANSYTLLTNYGLAVVLAVMGSIIGWLAWFRDLMASQYRYIDWIWTHIADFPGWLWDGLVALFYWVSGEIIVQLITLLNLLIAAWNLFLPGLRGFFEFLLNLLVDFWNMLAPMFGSMSGIFDVMWNLLVAVGENVIGIVTGLWGTLTTLGAIMFENFGETIGMPMSFYNAFNNAVSSEPFVFIPTCSAGGELWCNFIFGIQLVNQIAGQSIMYPIVIVLIIILTIITIQKHIWETIKPPGFR